MIIQPYFTSANRAVMSGVWKEIFNVFVDLTGISNPDNPDQKLRYHIKLDKYLFLNVIRDLYNQLNTPNSRCLVDDLYDKLGPSVIPEENICYTRAGREVVPQRNYLAEYERNIIFGGLYFVLVRTDKDLVDKSVVERVKRKLSYPRNPGIHYFNYFVDKLTEESIIGEHEQTTEDIEHPIYEVDYSDSEKRELSKLINAYMGWITTQGTVLRELKEIYNLDNSSYLFDYAVALECLDKCQKLLNIDVTDKQEVKEVTIDVIRRFIRDKFPMYHEQYHSKYHNPLSSPQPPQQAEVTECATTASTPQPTQEPIVETTNTNATQPVIDFDRFQSYFIDRFVKNNPNYDSVIDLFCSNDYSPRDKAYFAWRIHENLGHFKKDKRPRTFSKWYKAICDIFCLEYHPSYQPNKLKEPSTEAKKINEYLILPFPH